MVLEYHVNVMLSFQGMSPDYYGNVSFCPIMPRIVLCNCVCDNRRECSVRYTIGINNPIAHN